MKKKPGPTIHVRRAYDAVGDDAEYRVLVDRLWPRGVTKEALRLDAWLKDLAPTPELRTWFAHDVAKWTEFQRRYRAELQEEPAAGALASLAERLADGPVTLVYAARDEAHNGAVVVREVLSERSSGG